MAETSPSPEESAIRLPTSRKCPFDPPPELAELREKEPLTRLAYPDGHLGWLATSHSLVRTVLSDPRFSSKMEYRRSPVQRAGAQAIMGRPAIPGNFIAMDPPDHTKYRRLLNGQFTARRINALQPQIERIVQDRLDAMEQAGPPVDLVREFAQPIPSLVICELLGVEEGDRRAFQDNSQTVVSLTATPEQVISAMMSTANFLMELAASRREKPGDDLFSGLAATGDLSDEEVAGIGLLLLGAGTETTGNMLALGVYTLLSHPEQLAALKSEPELVDSTVEELLRYLTVVHYGPTRAPLEDVELEGQLVKAGEAVAVSLPAANRDPERFADPEAFDIRSNAAGHLAFGHGIHACLGQQLARIELRVGYSALFQRFPNLRLAVPQEQIPTREDMNTYGVHELPVTW